MPIFMVRYCITLLKMFVVFLTGNITQKVIKYRLQCEEMFKVKATNGEK